MKVEQFVMAYGIEQDRLRAVLPDGFMSLRPVLRVNAEVRDERTGYVEFNTAVEKDGVRGWLNIGYWDAVPFTREGKTVTFRTELLEIRFTGVGIEGSCPAEKDNAGCFSRDGRSRCVRRRPLPAARSSATVRSAGSWQTARTASASEKRCPPIRRRSALCTRRRISPLKTRRRSPAGRYWEPIRCGLSGNKTKRNPFGSKTEGVPFAYSACGGVKERMGSHVCNSSASSGVSRWRHSDFRSSGTP